MRAALMPALAQGWQQGGVDHGENGKMQIHLFNGFMNPFGGSEQETLFLYSLLKRKNAQVNLWATSSRLSPDLARDHPIRRISLLKGAFPKGGTYVFFGAHWRNKVWPALIPAPGRLIYVFNTFHPKIAGLVSKSPFWLNWPRAEIVLISQFQRQLLGLDGVIHPSPIDIGRYRPRATATTRFTVGRMSRDQADKHHPEDVQLYADCLSLGYGVCIQGGTVLKGALPEGDACQLLPEGFHATEEFFRHVDVFVYRTGTHVETFGRVVLEAMASGIPVVCHRHGGYAEHIRHGENGFLFDTSAEAMSIIKRMAGDKALRRRVGEGGRMTVEALYSAEALSRQADYYLAESPRA